MTDENFFTYLPISENNIRWDIYLTGAGVATINPQSSYPPPGHPDLYNFNWKDGRVLPEYQILLITEGEGSFESTGTELIHVKAGSIMLLFPGVWHRYSPLKSSGWKEYWLSWNGERLYRLLKKGVLDPTKPVLDLEHPDEIHKVFMRIINHIKMHPAENPSVLSAYAMEILALSIESESNHQTQQDNTVPMEYAHSVDDPIVFNALQLIWNHSYRELRVNDIVAQLPVSRRTLERKFTDVVKHSIRSEITRCRVARSKHLLENTQLPIKHIAYSVGFSSADRMGKVFQRELGITPKEYRNKEKMTRNSDA
ncbi:MAG: AraC family transcriptional regulator [Kiritimatiellae bacterium]|jgi:AraC-like DNA-binding protein|nr:AraC family transcriptional regulator [Kiritimatiellia bacterium]